MVVVLLLSSLGCDGKEDLRYLCHAAPSGRIHDGEVVAHQVGRVGDHVLLTWLLPDLSWTSQWFGLPELSSQSSGIDMGVGSERRPAWVPFEGGLEGYLLSDLARRPFETTPVSDIVTWWRFEPDPLRSVPSSVTIDAPEGCLSCVVLSTVSAAAGLGGTWPTVEAGDRLLGAAPAIPSACTEGAPVLNHLRLQTFDDRAYVGRATLWSNEPPCAQDFANDQSLLNPTLVSLGDGHVGVIFRSNGPVPQAPRFFSIDVDGRRLSEPRSVGGDWSRISTGFVGGWQVRAVRLGETILFVEGYERADHCHVIRLMNEDGSDARNAPWQLPCVDDRSIATFSVELGTFGDVAVLAYSERYEEGRLDVTSETPWWEDVKVVLLTADGRAASTPITVTEPRSTALTAASRTPDSGPFVADFHVSLSAHDDTMPLVAWTDRRPDAPGVYAREIVCEPLP